MARKFIVVQDGTDATWFVKDEATGKSVELTASVLLLPFLESLCVRVACLDDAGLNVFAKSAIDEAKKLRKKINKIREKRHEA